MSDTESISSTSLVDSNIEDSGSDDDASRFMLAPIATNRRSRSRASTYKHVRNWDSPVRRERDSTISISSSSRLSVYDRNPHLRSNFDQFDARSLLEHRQGQGSSHTEYNPLPSLDSRTKGKLIAGEFIDFNRLLALPVSTTAKQGQASTSSEIPTINDFATWARAFHIYAAHRSYDDPRTTLPLFNYLGVVSQLARKWKKDNQWLNYDVAFRQFAAQNSDHSLWNTIHQATFFDQVVNDASVDSDSEPDRKRRKKPIECFHCGGPHIKPQCPELRSLKKKDQQSFRGRPAGRGAQDFDDICQDFNEGRCSSPCRHFKYHACFLCLPNKNHSHGSFNHYNFLAEKPFNSGKDKDSA